MYVCVCVHVKGMLRASWFAVIFHSSDRGLAEETVLIIHQMLIDAGSEKRKEEQKERAGYQ